MVNHSVYYLLARRGSSRSSWDEDASGHVDARVDRRDTGNKWVTRHNAQGAAGLENRKPVRLPRGRALAKLECHAGAREIRASRLFPTTVSRRGLKWTPPRGGCESQARGGGDASDYG